MKTDLLIYVSGGMCDDDLSFNGAFIPDALREKLDPLDVINDIFISVPEAYAGRLAKKPSVLTRNGEDDVDFWKNLFTATGSDHIIKIFADCPFLDPDIIKEMADIHFRYLAEFTYSENLPEGLTCEIVAKDMVTAIPDFKEKTLPLSKVVRSNMNQFDIELYYRDPDIRDKRLTFRASDPREKRVMENIVAISKTPPAYGEIRDLIESNPEVLYTGPSYLEIEITGRCDLDCIFCYRKSLEKKHDDMDAKLLQKILGDMKIFSLPYTLCFGGSGEPLMHPEFYAMLETAEQDALVQQIIVETNGVLADANYRNFLAGKPGNKIKTIININGHNKETYTQLHGGDCYDRVTENVSALKDSLSDAATDALHVQIMKINETEPFLDSYYDFWEKKGVPIILQKQNTYTGLILDRRYSDLSPLERIPCWHLQRDLFILADGTVPFCRVDVNAQSIRGNVREQDIATIWAKGKESFISDYRHDFSSCPDCESCDEWYTFNF